MDGDVCIPSPTPEQAAELIYDHLVNQWTDDKAYPPLWIKGALKSFFAGGDE